MNIKKIYVYNIYIFDIQIAYVTKFIVIILNTKV